MTTQVEVIEECEAMPRGDILVKVVCDLCGNRLIGVVDQRGPWHFYQSARHPLPVWIEQQEAFPGEHIDPGWTRPMLVVNGPEDPETTSAFCDKQGHGAATFAVADLKAAVDRAKARRKPTTIRVRPANRR